MKKFILSVTVFWASLSILPAQVKTDSAFFKNRTETHSPEINIQAKPQGKNLYPGRLSDTAIATPTFRYVPHHDTINRAKKTYYFNDTVITPEIRFYPAKKREE